jgi:TRAP-type C4-dicarboxylate transport system permease small subunit
LNVCKTKAIAVLNVGERLILRLAELAAAALVALEIVVLLAGVVSRFLLHRPIVWPTNSPASYSFGWLCLGA